MRSRTVRSAIRRAQVVQVLAVILLALLGVGGVLTYRALNLRSRATSDALIVLRLVEREIVSAETGLRGYALTKDDRFLEPYEQAFPRIDDGLDRLGEHPDEAARIRFLAEDWRRSFAEPVLDAVEGGRPGEIIERFLSGDGRRRIDAIETTADELAAHLRDELDDRRATADRVAVIAAVVAAMATVATVGMTVGARRRLESRLVTPITSLAAAAQQLGQGNLGVRSAARGTTEVDALTTAFNAMADETERTVGELRQLDRMKSEFVSVVSHELRTPLTSIRGSLGLLDSGALGPVPEKAVPMLRIAVTNTDRLVRLINDILDLERIESGSDAFDLQPHAARELLEEAVANVQGAADEAGVRLVVGDAGEAPVLADRDRVVQALTNLVANAVKFSDGGTTVRVGAVDGDGVVRLTVVDQGRGIPADKLDAVFGRFEQVDSSDARDKGGTGLGLAIVKTIAERHGGRVAVTSEVGVGSTFELVLPAATEP